MQSQTLEHSPIERLVDHARNPRRKDHVVDYMCPVITDFGMFCDRRKPLRYIVEMKLIFLHGAPATGKLTVAKALLRTVPGRLFDNHAAIDVARTVFDFGAPGFWELVHTVRCSVLDAAAQQRVPLVVMTYCYA